MQRSLNSFSSTWAIRNTKIMTIICAEMITISSASRMEISCLPIYIYNIILIKLEVHQIFLKLHTWSTISKLIFINIPSQLLKFNLLNNIFILKGAEVAMVPVPKWDVILAQNWIIISSILVVPVWAISFRAAWINGSRMVSWQLDVPVSTSFTYVSH